MAQESLAVLRDLDQPPAQPFELPAERLEIGGAADRDRLCELAVAELADRIVDVADRATEEQGDDERHTEADRHERRRLPQQSLPCVIGIGLQAYELPVDLAAREHGKLAAAARQWPELAQRAAD